jgi:fatty acid desaturase
MTVRNLTSLNGGDRSGAADPASLAHPLESRVECRSNPTAPPSTAESISFRSDPIPGDLRAWVAELSPRSSRIYWTDFLASLSAGYLAFFLFPIAHPFGLRAIFAFTVAVFAIYRAVIFTHEVAHMQRDELPAFRVAWNLLCGIPLLVPSFLYETHYQHHSRQTYGSREDGEYLSFAHLPRRTSVLYVLASFLTAPVLVARFLILAPLRWIFPPFNQFVLTRASALAIDGEYRRPLKPGRTPWQWVMQEAACFTWCALIAGLTLSGRIPIGRLLEWAAVVTAIVLINSIRTLGAHGYRGNGEPMSFAEQVRDSNDFTGILAEVWAPTGLRYHAMHHLFPQLPYHALPEARRRVLTWGESLNPIRQSTRGSLLSVLLDLMRKERTTS